MPVNSMQSSWGMAFNGNSAIWDFNQAPANTHITVCLTKTRHGTFSSGAGGYAAIIGINGSDAGYVPAAFQQQVKKITWGVVAEGQYAEACLTVYRF
jgi:hypothetical protein